MPLEALIVALADPLATVEVKFLFSHLVCQVQFGELVFAVLETRFERR